MSKIGSLLKEEILRLSRKEARSEVLTVRKSSAQHRRDIAGLKRQVSQLTARLAQSEKRAASALPVAPVGEATEPLRFSAKGLRSQRKRLGLSAAEYATLVGVTQLSIYNWERGVTRPRQEWLSVLAGLRNLPKKEAQARLDQQVKKSVKPAAKKKARKKARKTAKRRS